MELLQKGRNAIGLTVWIVFAAGLYLSLVWAPADHYQGEVARIMNLHVPLVKVSIPGVLEGRPAPPFAGSDLLDGRPVSLAQMKGRVVLLNFWASWRAECVKEHANLLALQRRFGSRSDFALIGVAYQDQAEEARAFLARLGTAYPNIRDGQGGIGIDYGVYGVPETFLIGRDGVIRCKHFGPLLGAAYDKVATRWLPALLAGKALESCD